jgi:aminoglycoside/choline kinase family phosphotransferase
VVLLEWPERIADHLPPDRLEIALRLTPGEGDGTRNATLLGFGPFGTRLAQAQAVALLLNAGPFKGAARTFITGDASTRAYERLRAQDGTGAILMISPPRADAPVARFGRPYHHVARLAGDIRPWIAMDRALAAQGVSTPRILALDALVGVAVLEDLGQEPVTGENGPSPDRFLQAVELLAVLHDRGLPDTVPGEGDDLYRIPPYDMDAYLIEAELVLEWYAPHVARSALPASARAAFIAICTKLFNEVLQGPKTWCLRDFHSPNLIWLEKRSGMARIGLVDFQDTVIGHPAYDVASLLQDARVTVPDSLELKLIGAYAQRRRSVNALFDVASFAEAYAILGVQRATKILGGFARLDKRDGKPQYLRHLPRIESYLAKGLAHPALGELRGWYRTHLPRVLRDAGAVR